MTKRFLIPALLLLLSISFMTSSCKEKQGFPAGYWQGLIMDQFTVILELEETGGRIYSYDGDMIFQNDSLTEITAHGDSITFYIADKQSWFKGLFTEVGVTGVFTFSDGNSMEANFTPKGREELADKGLLPNVIPSETKMYAKHSAEEIKADLIEYGRVLKLYHPAVINGDTNNINQLISRVSSGITDSMEIRDILPSFMEISASLQCSHTRVRQGSAVRRAIEHYQDLLPAQLMMKEGKLWLTGRVAGEEYQPGLQEVVEINEISSEAIIEKLKSIIPVNNINQDAFSYEFNRYQIAYLPVLIKAEQFDISYLDEAGNTQHKLFQGVPVAELDWAFPQSDMSWHVSSIPSMETAILTIPTFVYPDPMGLPDYLDSLFNAFKTEGIQNLIIDVRGNEGGPPFSSRILLSYLIDKPFAYFSSANRSVNDPGMEDLRELYTTIPQSPLVYGGKQLTVISDPGCMSTTGHFISLIAYHKAGKIAGSSPESHASCYDNTLDIVLPNTGIECSVPTITFTTNVASDMQKPNSLLIPDIEAFGDLGIKLSDDDSVLEQVLEATQLNSDF